MSENISFELDKSLLRWLGRTMKALDYYLIDKFDSKGIPLTKAQMITLRILSGQDGIAQNNLAFITNRDKASLTRLIDTMEKKELVHRTHSTADKRVKQVFITKKGRHVIDSAMPALHEIMNEVQDGLSQKEIDTTLKVLKIISKNINADELTAPIIQS
jgi:DNA-binding MarR family transcriptional regulator